NNRHMLRPLALLGLALFSTVFFVPTPAFADAPITRGQTTTAQGNTTHSTTMEDAWKDVQALPLPTQTTHAPILPRPRLQTQQDGGMWCWLGLEPNIGKWVMDSGLGVTSGIAATTNQTLLLAIQAAIGDMSSITACESATAFVFCAPEAMFFGGSGF